jgi:hypothetical protein
VAIYNSNQELIGLSNEQGIFSFNEISFPLIITCYGYHQKKINKITDTVYMAPQAKMTKEVIVGQFDVNGQIEWNYIYGIADLIPATNASEFALNSLNFYNQKLYGLDIDVTQNQDGYVVMGSNYDSIPALNRIILMRLDLNGLLQTKAIHGPADDSYQAWVRAMDCEGGSCFITGQLNTNLMGPIPGGLTRPGFILKVNEIDLNLSSTWGTTWGLSNPKRFAPNPIKSYMLQDVIANPDGPVVSASINENDACWYGGFHENNGIGAIVRFNNQIGSFNYNLSTAIEF